MLYDLFWQRSNLIGALVLPILFTACAKEPSSTFYYQSGKIAQVVRCPQGEYQLCLEQISKLCHQSGYTVHEKIRQIKSGIWIDSAETLVVAECNSGSTTESQ